MGGGDLSGAGRKLGGAGDRDPGKGGAVDCLLCRRRTTPRIAGGPAAVTGLKYSHNISRLYKATGIHGRQHGLLDQLFCTQAFILHMWQHTRQ